MSGYWSVIAIVGGAWLSGFIAGLFWRDCRAAIEREREVKKGADDAQ